jgi:hypothetical protein
VRSCRKTRSIAIHAGPVPEATIWVCHILSRRDRACRGRWPPASRPPCPCSPIASIRAYHTGTIGCASNGPPRIRSTSATEWPRSSRPARTCLNTTVSRLGAT